MAKNRTIPFGYCMKNGEITTEPKEVYAVVAIFDEYLKGRSLSGSVYTYLGSTLPTDPNGNFATINEGKYIITKWTNDYKGHGAPAYNICNLDGTDKACLIIYKITLASGEGKLY